VQVTVREDGCLGRGVEPLRLVEQRLHRRVAGPGALLDELTHLRPGVVGPGPRPPAAHRVQWQRLCRHLLSRRSVEHPQQGAQRGSQLVPRVVDHGGVGQFPSRQQPGARERPGIDGVVVVRHELRLRDGEWESCGQPREESEFSPEARQCESPAGEAEDPAPVHEEHGVVPALRQRLHGSSTQRGERRGDQRGGPGGVGRPLGRPSRRAHHGSPGAPAAEGSSPVTRLLLSWEFVGERRPTSPRPATPPRPGSCGGRPRPGTRAHPGPGERRGHRHLHDSDWPTAPADRRGPVHRAGSRTCRPSTSPRIPPPTSC
jgi:hypothetical protein